jgi:predicted kinase
MAPRLALLIWRCHDIAGVRSRLIIVCGLPGSGKTTHARSLAARHDGFRLSADDWMEALDVNLWDSEARDRIETLQWELARQLLRRGQTVIIEWGTWGRPERDTLREGARALDAGVELRYLDEPVDVLWERVRSRSGRSADDSRTARVLRRQH